MRSLVLRNTNLGNFDVLKFKLLMVVCFFSFYCFPVDHYRSVLPVIIYIVYDVLNLYF